MPSEFESIQVTGKCDSGCDKLATQWFGNTSAATCGNKACVELMEASYAEHCAEMEAQFAFEKEMEEMYGENPL